MTGAETGRSGGLTLSQHEWVQWIPADSDTTFEDDIWTLLPGDGLPPDRAVQAVRDVLLRHEGLRSLVARADGGQHAEPVDDRIGEVVVIADAAAAADDGWRRVCFRVGEQWPIRVVLFVAGRSVVRVGVVVDHVAIDPWGMTVLHRELRQALRARAAGREPFGPEPVEQPIDVAEAEASPAGLAYQRRAQAHWQECLGRVADTLDGRTPGPRPAAKPDAPLFASARLSSPRAAEAARAIAASTGVSPASTFLLAFGTAVCAVEESAGAGLFAISANRTTAESAGSVRKATMTLPVLVRADRGPFRSALADCAAQQLRGHRFANADPRVTEKMCHDILGDHYETAVAYPRFSYLTAPAGTEDGAADRITFGEPRSLGARFMLTVTQHRRGARLDLEWSRESGWDVVAEDLLRRVQDTVTQGAASL
jgi:hypothetical protein